jgi:hypothetical protein
MLTCGDFFEISGTTRGHGQHAVQVHGPSRVNVLNETRLPTGSGNKRFHNLISMEDV